VAVVRLSGPQSGIILKRITNQPLPQPRHAQLRQIVDIDKNECLDSGLVLWFPEPSSFTGENVVELHLHGGRAIIDGVLSLLAKQPDTRPAVAGEFTRRAFDNGKLDLTGVEGLADLLAAETASQRRQALRQLQGELGALYEAWRAGLIGALAHIEAHIDFSDEDLPENLIEKVRPRLISLISEISAHLDDNHRGEILRRGLRVAIIGAPNVGKSSIINALSNREAAIVTPIAGTTRDIIEVHLDLGGYLVTLADTAGLRDSDDPSEAEGVRRARQRAVESDLTLAVFDAAEWPRLDSETMSLCDKNTIRVVNKIDLLNKSVNQLNQQEFIAVSAERGDGLEELQQRIQVWALAHLGGGESPSLSRERHRLELTQCLDNLGQAVQLGKDTELIAEDVRLAARALGRITGRIDVEDVLDVVFADFCIGK